MILSSSQPNPDTQPVFTVGETVHHITGGGRSFRIATVTHNKGTRIGIRYVMDGTEKRVPPWNLVRVEPTKERTVL